MIKYVRYILILISCLSIYGIGYSYDLKDNPPNIILIMADDLGIGDVEYTGFNPYVETKALNEMAHSGIRFDRFYSQAPVCSPTRASVLTGRHPFRYGIFEANIGCLREQETTISEILARDGYHNGHFGKWHLGLINDTCHNKKMCPADPLNFGYQEYFATHHSIRTYDPNVHHVVNGPDSLNLDSTYIRNGIVVKDLLYGDDSKIIMDEAIKFINIQRNGKFFTTIWFHTPHKPVMGTPELVAYYSERFPELSESQCHYYASITAMDQQIGRLRDSLETWGISNNTMLWFCSDNGPTGEGQSGIFKGAKRHLFEGGIRVPGILVWPEKIKSSRIETAVATTSDYLPTILEATGSSGAPLHPLDGKSLMPVIENRAERRPEPLCFQSHGSMVCLTEDYKLMLAGYKGSVNLGLETGIIHNGSEWMLFDMHKDSLEAKNIISKFPEVADSLRLILKNWMDTVYLSFIGEDYASEYYPEQEYRFSGGIKGEKTEDLSENKLGAIYINSWMLPGFEPDSFEYVYPLMDETLPSISAVPVAINADIDTIILPGATFNPDQNNSATIRVTSATHSIATYQIAFNLIDADTTAYLEKVKINGIEMKTFHPYKYKYFINLPYGTEKIPAISPMAYASDAKIEIEPATSIINAREEKRTTVIKVYSSDMLDSTKYSFVFSMKAPSANTFLKNIELNGIPLRTFSPYQCTYQIQVPDSDLMYYLNGIPLDTAAKVFGDSIEICKGVLEPVRGTIKILAENGFAEWAYHLVFQPTEDTFTVQSKNKFNPELSVYPNPCRDFLHISTTAKKFTIDIYDISGKKIESLQNNRHINTEHFNHGVYFLALKNQEDHSTASIKFLK